LPFVFAHYRLYIYKSDETRLLRWALLVEGLLGAVVLVARTVLVLVIAVSISVSTLATRALAGLLIGAIFFTSSAAETKAFGHVVEDVNAVVDTAEELLARTLSEDGHVGQRVHALVGARGESAVGDEAIDIVGRIDEVIRAGESCDVLGWGTGTITMDFVVLTDVRVGTEALCQSVARVPVGGEERVRVAKVTSSGVLALAGLLVNTDGVALGAIIGLGVAVLGVVATEDVKAVTVVGSDDDESVLELADLLEVLHGGLDGVVKFKELAQSTVVVERVHLLIDRCSLRHEEPTLVAVSLGARVEDVNSLKSHLFETRLVESVGAAAVRAVLVADKVVGVDVPVEPLLHVANREDTKGLFGV
jgi:hypothetical protein